MKGRSFQHVKWFLSTGTGSAPVLMTREEAAQLNKNLRAEITREHLLEYIWLEKSFLDRFEAKTDDELVQLSKEGVITGVAGETLLSVMLSRKSLDDRQILFPPNKEPKKKPKVNPFLAVLGFGILIIRILLWWH